MRLWSLALLPILSACVSAPASVQSAEQPPTEAEQLAATEAFVRCVYEKSITVGGLGLTPEETGNVSVSQCDPAYRRYRDLFPNSMQWSAQAWEFREKLKRDIADVQRARVKSRKPKAQPPPPKLFKERPSGIDI